jgi:uncharacterized protein (DUF305 family)
VASVACATGAAGSADGTGTEPAGGAATASATEDRAAGAGGEYTEADVRFMTGMIHHHAQAVVMARMAPTHGASPAVRRLTSRILNSQKTEISLMRDWLRDRGEPAPEPAAVAEGAAEEPDLGAPAEGWDAGPQMPGLLSDRQMARLDAARGETFDRLFLTLMIRHHEGAVAMVDDLVASRGAAREEAVFRLASGIRADQSTEIDRMRSMLRDQLSGAGSSQ